MVNSLITFKITGLHFSERLETLTSGSPSDLKQPLKYEFATVNANFEPDIKGDFSSSHLNRLLS